MEKQSFKKTAVVACGTMSPEINYLADSGFLDTPHIFFTPPGLHQDIHELESRLVKSIQKARAVSDGVIVVYGGKYCYVNPDNPTRLMSTIIKEQGEGVVRIKASHCMGMLADDDEMKRITTELGGGAVWFMTPGWIQYRKQVFKGWDKAVANENFPRHPGGAVVLDGIGYLDQYMAQYPEDFLDYCDWMGIIMQAYPIALDRFKNLLAEALAELNH